MPDFDKERGCQSVMRSANDHNVNKSIEPVSASAGGCTLYPVYVLCVHTGTPLANAIKRATGAHFSHCTISFDPGMENMYTFGRKTRFSEFSNGSFVKESLYLYPYSNKGARYALYCIPATGSQIAAMKARLAHFARSNARFRYDFLGLIKNLFGIADEPEKKWFCSRFVADIINAGTEPGHTPLIREPSLLRPEDFLHADFALYVTGGLTREYDPVLVKEVTRKLLQAEATRRSLHLPESDLPCCSACT